MKKIKIKFQYYPLIPYACVFSMQLITYYLTKLININAKYFNLTQPFDNLIPFIPASITIYVLCYAWWFITPFLIAQYTDKKRFYQFVLTSFFSFVICFVFFITVPTTIVRPNFVIDDFFTWATAFIYSTDVPNNLFPSMHCLVSWLCYIPLRNYKGVPKKLVTFQCVFAILVCISTQTIKQHYIVDLVMGIAIAELVFYIVKKFNMGEKTNKYFTKINIRLKMEKKEDNNQIK